MTLIKTVGRIADGLGNASRNFKKGSVMRSIAKLLKVPRIEPGTLNVEIGKDFSELDDGEYDLCLKAVEYNGREWVKIKRCKVNGLQCVIVRPYDHFHVEKFKRRIEFMAPMNLRNKLNLQDCDEVSVEFQGDDCWWDS